MPEEIIDHRDFCQRLIEFLADCPCNNPNPITAVCPCYALSSDSSSCLRRQRRVRAARDVVAAVPQSTANPTIPPMNQHALVATIIRPCGGPRGGGYRALRTARVPAIECNLHSV
ncbi:MAG TPA: hypothetical protein VFP43_14930, partial [Mesorhizobium sp.]|nr:hypothetical protein [Mesorhizobium sp.]